MEFDSLTPSERTGLDEMLGYLNFSSGMPDSRFQTHCNAIYHRLDAPGAAPWRKLQHLLVTRLGQLGAEANEGSTFADTHQAEAVVDIVFRRLLESYRRFHRDLLYHQSDRNLFGPFFLARACEAVLAVGGPWNETDRIVDEAIGRLNDFIGYRPVAVLRTRQRIEPYAHEWVRPLPLFVSGTGVEHGPYHDLILGALDILRQTDDDILRQASFDPDHLDELALDPRAYDFDHPINKRPNYHFGQWDPHRLDSRGNYRRFVLQEVTLEAIWQRAIEPNALPADERLIEACTVLAGTILMGSAVSGGAPDAYDSNTTLATLVPRIAACRDAFYERTLKRVGAAHGERLREEAARLRQPFGGARQHLNQRLARLRASQLEHVHLAQLFARMGYPDASTRQSRVVPVASARILCEISSRFTTGHRSVRRGELEAVVHVVDEIDDLLHRGIECGALVDPWNILGFQGQFSLFPAIENSVRDHRVDVLIHIMREIFDLLVCLAGEAAASGNDQVRQLAAGRLSAMAAWWDEFASVEVAGVEHVSGQEAVDSATQLASALGAWRAAGESAGDLAFWRKHVEGFDSPKPYALVIGSLIDRRDLVASRALLTHWIGQAERVPLSEGEHSFHDLALRWMQCATANETQSSSAIAKFFDHLEANAESLWEVPHLESSPPATDGLHTDETDEDDIDDGDAVYGAAYEDVVYRDTTADGTESSMMESGPPRTDFALDAESERLNDRLAFLITLAGLWRVAAQGQAREETGTCDDVGKAWLERIQHNAEQLGELLDAVAASRLPEPIGTQESMVEYDRCRLVKESLLAKVVFACTQTAAARRALLVVVDPVSVAQAKDEGLDSCEQLFTELCRALHQGDTHKARDLFPKLRDRLDALPVLYVPLARRGDPRRIVAAQGVLQILLDLGRLLPRAGLLAEACQLVQTAQAMERHRPPGDGVVSEFDRVFESTYTAIVESLIDALPGDADHEHELVEILEQLTDALMQRWTDHSRSLRLSVLEKISSREHWQQLVKFIKRFGHDIFVPRFMNHGNLRAILHQSVGAYLERLEKEGDCDWALLAELGKSIPRATAVELLTLAIDAIVENYAEYRDYNCTTTQSDQGELLDVLLDFLRLKASYDRFAWTIRPFLLAHAVLVRRGKATAAERWRQSIAARTSEAADWHLRRLEELVKQYGVRLPSVSDRLHERFVRTLATDRVRALVEPAIEQARADAASTSFELLEHEIDAFTEEPTGSGLEVPDWLASLEEEADRVLAGCDDARKLDPCSSPASARLNWDDLVAQVRSIEQVE